MQGKAGANELVICQSMRWSLPPPEHLSASSRAISTAQVSSNSLLV